MKSLQSPLLPPVALLVLVASAPMTGVGGQDAHLSPSLSAEEVARLDSHLGAFRTEEGGTQAISRFIHGDFPVYLFTDFGLGWRGTLWPRPDGSFDIIERGEAPGRASARLSLAHGPEGRISVFRKEGLGPRRAVSIDVRERPIFVPAGDIRLAGSLFLPPDPPPHPALVFVHGSGPATRNDFREWSYFFAANGIAVLAYDKRGAGGSTGDWREARFDDLADDVVHAVHYLLGHEAIDNRRIGLCGGSQGAWVAPLAAAGEPRISWLALIGGGAISPARQERYRRLRLVEDAGHEGVDMERATRILDLYFEYLRTEDDEVARELSRAHEELANKPWFDSLGIPDELPIEEEWPVWMRRFQRELFFDPVPSLATGKIPILVVMGSEDQGFPTAETVEEYRMIVSEDRLTVEIVQGADHGLFVSGDGSRPRHQAPEAFESLLAWIREQTAAGSEISKAEVQDQSSRRPVRLACSIGLGGQALVEDYGMASVIGWTGISGRKLECSTYFLGRSLPPE